MAWENVSFRNSATLDRPSLCLAATRNLPPSPRNTQTLPYYPRPRPAGRPRLPAGFDNPRVANRRRRPSPPPAAASIPTSASRSPRALRPLLGPATITPVERPSSKLRRTAARKHRRSSGRDGARGPRRPWRARMTPTGQPRSSHTHRLRCPGRRAHSPAARRPLPGPGMDTRERRSGRGRPPCPPTPRHSHRARSRPRTPPGSPSIMQRAAGLQVRAWMCGTTPRRRRLPCLRPLRPGRSGREVAKDAGRRRLAYLLGERVKPLISIDSSAHCVCRGAHTPAAHMNQGSLIYFSGTEDGEHSSSRPSWVIKEAYVCASGRQCPSALHLANQSLLCLPIGTQPWLWSLKA